MTDKARLFDLLCLFHNDVEERPGQLKYGSIRMLFNEAEELIQVQSLNRSKSGRVVYKVLSHD